MRMHTSTMKVASSLYSPAQMAARQASTRPMNRPPTSAEHAVEPADDHHHQHRQAEHAHARRDAANGADDDPGDGGDHAETTQESENTRGTLMPPVGGGLVAGGGTQEGPRRRARSGTAAAQRQWGPRRSWRPRNLWGEEASPTMMGPLGRKSGRRRWSALQIIRPRRQAPAQAHRDHEDGNGRLAQQRADHGALDHRAQQPGAQHRCGMASQQQRHHRANVKNR